MPTPARKKICRVCGHMKFEHHFYNKFYWGKCASTNCKCPKFEGK
jgi:hypothetical protein